MLVFDIGANRGDATLVALSMGARVIAVEAAPRVYKQLVSNFIYNSNVVPLKYAVSNVDNETVTFYEADEDGLSTLNKDWLTDETMPYAGKPYREVVVNTTTIDSLVRAYGTPELIKVDVEGAEWLVFKGMAQKYGMLTFEWTDATLTEHELQLDYLYNLGYREYAPQFIVNHLDQPEEWFPLQEDNTFALVEWVSKHEEAWTSGGWKEANLRPTADVGMIWLR